MTNSQNNDHYAIISADCHAGLPTEQYRPYLDSRYHAALDDFLAERRAMLAARAEAGMSYEEYEEEWTSQEGYSGGWDAATRDKELDNDGVVGEIMFPDSDSISGTTCPPFGAGIGATGELDGDLAFAGATAHNRWLAELCADSPLRRAGVALVPMVFDVERAAKMVEESHEMGLRGGIAIPTMWVDYEPYHHPKYDIVWERCAALDMPVHVHSGPAPRHEYLDNMGIYVSEVILWAYRPLRFMLWGGVFERHPDLKFVVTESGAYWAPDMLWQMHNQYQSVGGAAKIAKQLGAAVSRSPVEYFDENCYLGASTTKRNELARRYAIGVRNIMWGNDFPHPEGTWPHTDEYLKKNFGDIPIDETAQMLGGVAAEVYNFDLEALAPTVERIGPTPADLGQDESQSQAKWETAKRLGRYWETGADPAEAFGVL